MIGKFLRSTAAKRAYILAMLFLLFLTQVYTVSANSADSFFKILSAVPSKPTLISPDGQAGINPIYRWTPSEGAVDYAVFVGVEDASEPPKINDFYTVDCSTECTLFLPEKQLTSGKTYIWMVAGRNAEGYGEFSNEKTFLTVPPPDTAVLLSPKSTEPQNTYTPTYRWEAGDNIEQYRLVVSNHTAQNIIDLWYDASSICTGGFCEVTPITELIAGQYNWWVIAKNNFGESESGDGESFEVLLQPPPAVSDLIDPSELSVPTPEFLWGSVSSATQYQLVVINDQSSQPVIQQLFTAQQLGCSAGEAICSIRWNEALPLGFYHWSVQTKNGSSMDIGFGAGYGAPSYSEDFEIRPALSKPTLIGPSGDIATIRPTFSWDHQDLATSYFISVRKGTLTVFENWYQITDSELSCDQLICTLTSPVNLEVGSHTWTIQAAAYGLASPVSDELDFTFVQMSLTAIAISNEGDLADGHAFAPSISEDGQIVAFYSYADNIISGCGDPSPNKDHDHPGNYKTDIFVYDRSTSPPTITCVSRNDDGQVGNDSSLNPIVSSNGQYITFTSKATNLIWRESTQQWVGDYNEKFDVFVHDRNIGQTRIISLAYDGSQSYGDSTIGMITPDGKYAVFTSLGSNLTEDVDNNDTSDVFLRDLENETTILVSKTFLNTGSGNGPSEGWQISDNGRYIPYQSEASNLTAQQDDNDTSDIFLWNNGVTYPVSVANNFLSMGNKASVGPAMSSNGAYIAYYTAASNIVAGCGDQTGLPPTENDVIIYTTDGSAGTICLNSNTTDVLVFSADSYTAPALSRNGRILTFESESSLLDEDTNGLKDVYYFDLAEGTVRLISQTIDGAAGNDESSFPVVSGTGTNIVFASKATNFADGALYQNIYLTDLTGVINYGPPRNLSASEIKNNQVTLSWSASADAEFIEGYRIYQNNVAVATTPQTGKVISGLACDTTYNFKVRAYVGDQESIPSNTILAQTSKCLITINPTTRWTSDFSLDQGWNVNLHVRTSGDVDGDGKDDIVGFGTDGIYVAISNGTSFQPISKWSSGLSLNDGWAVSSHPRMVADVNGDGLDDVIGIGYTNVYVGLSNGTSFDSIQKWGDAFNYNEGWRVDMHPIMAGDVNGDGKADLIGIGFNYIYVALSNGTSFGPLVRWGSAFIYDEGWRVDMHPRMAGDVNGDGKADLIGIGYSYVYVALSNGTTFSPLVRWGSAFIYDEGWRVNMHPRIAGDITGDGLVDLLGYGYTHVYVSQSSGNNFSALQRCSDAFNYDEGWRIETSPRIIGDVNGDGKKDIIGFGNSFTYVGLSQYE